MIAILFLLFLLSLVWTAVFFAPVPVPVVLAVIPTLAVALGLAAAFAWRRFRARQASQEIERTLQKQGDAHAKLARPDLQPEIAQLRDEFAKAVGSLKASKLARGGNNALSVLPWYMIVGPPGVGKSTALINSGLKFPYLSKSGGVRGLGGTRNCQWWLTNEGVILDTAGRYATEDDDRDEWFSFLDMLVKTRPRRPINGLLVAVSAVDLIQQGPEAAEALGQRLRERVDEVMARLKMIVPVYVMFMKCDLLAGFVEMFGQLPKAERGQVWGFTEPLGGSEEAGELFRHRFDELAQVLEVRALQQIAKVKRMEERERVFQFPAQFDALKASATEFIAALFAANVYQDTPLLRGAYFSSATQQGRPVDQVMAAIARAGGVDLPVSEERSLQSVSYFLNDTFAKVIFPDRELAIRSSKESTRLRNLGYGYAAAGFIAAALLTLLPTWSFRRQQLLIDGTSQAVRDSKPQLPGAPTGLSSLAPLERQVRLVMADQKRTSLTMGFGMNQDAELLAQVGGLYAAKARGQLLQPVFDATAVQLREFVRAQRGLTGPLAREQMRYLEALKLYLVLSRRPDEPSDDAWASSAVADAALPGNSRPSDHEQARSLAELYLELMAGNPALRMTRDEQLVSAARDVLRRLNQADLALYQVLEEAEPKCRTFGLSLSDIVGAAAAQLRSSKSVRGVFTKECLDGAISAKFRDGVKVSNGWVLGPTGASEDAAGITPAVSSRYFEQYLSEWRNFLESIDVDQPGSLAQLADLLDGLTSGDPSALARLFSKLGSETRLASADGLTGGMFQRVKDQLSLGGLTPKAGTDPAYTAQKVQEEFERLARFGEKPPAPAGGGGGGPPTPLEKYLQTLRGVLDALRAELQNPQGAKGLMGLVGNATVQVESQLAAAGTNVWWQQPFLKRLLLSPLKVAGDRGRDKLLEELNQKWCDSVYLEFGKSLSGRYPFATQGSDAAIADVAAYFRPQQGTLWSFYDANLQADVQRMGASFHVVGGPTRQIFGAKMLDHLSQAQEMTNDLFPPNAKDVSVSFGVNVRPSTDFDLIRVSVNGQNLEYRNGPETWPQWKWPSDGNASGAQIEVHSIRGETAELHEAGEWGLFRLLEAGTLKARTSSVFTVGWRFPKLSGSPEVLIDFRPGRSQTPFIGAVRPGEKIGPLLHAFRVADVSPPPGVGGGPVVCR